MTGYKYAVLLLLTMFMGCQTTTDKERPAPSIDIRTGSDRPELFGKNIISTSLPERDVAIHPQGKELIYTLGDYKNKKMCLVVVRKVNGDWGKPGIMPISGKYRDLEPFYSHDGDRLFFVSNRPVFNDNTRNDYNIWFSNRTANGWSEPEALDSVVNTRGHEFYPSLSEKGNLFYTARRADGIGGEDIFMSEFREGRFQAPQPLPEAVNTEFDEFNAYVSPGEDLIVFSSYGRPDDSGRADLYISRKDAAGKWTPAKNMGPLVNSDQLDYCPFIDWENRNFYFTSERAAAENSGIENIDSLKQAAHSILNGFGNIYKISLDALEQTE